MYPFGGFVKCHTNIVDNRKLRQNKLEPQKSFNLFYQTYSVKKYIHNILMSVVRQVMKNVIKRIIKSHNYRIVCYQLHIVK